jgi:hypothetical protein
MKSSWNRRQFLVATGVAVSAAVTEHTLLNPKRVLAASFTRKDVGGLTASSPEIVSYAKAVTAMQALPATDPRSWSYQAAIHGTLAPCPCPTSWNTCEHGTEFFWSWHRMYLYYFEKIVRRMSGDYGWALPYWNWQLASENKLPLMFRDPTSSLYTANRNTSINAGTGSLPSTDVDCSLALGDLAFSAAVEDIQGPHGNVHVDVGGWMGSVPTSAQDPIFYFHHSNVDRLWDIWLAQGGGRGDPVGDPAWKGKTYTFFDENGTAVTMTDCDVLRAAQQLNYVYDSEPPQVNEYCIRIWKFPPWLWQIVQVIHFPISPIEVNSERVNVPIELGEQSKRIQQIAASSEQRLFVVLSGIEAATQPGVTYQVYIGLPANEPPEPKSPYYVGTFSLFGLGVRDEGHHGSTPATYRFPANRAVTAALRRDETPTLTIVPSGILIDGKPSRPEAKATLHIGAVSFAEAAETRARQTK